MRTWKTWLFKSVGCERDSKGNAGWKIEMEKPDSACGRAENPVKNPPEKQVAPPPSDQSDQNNDNPDEEKPEEEEKQNTSPPLSATPIPSPTPRKCSDITFYGKCVEKDMVCKSESSFFTECEAKNMKCGAFCVVPTPTTPPLDDFGLHIQNFSNRDYQKIIAAYTTGKLNAQQVSEILNHATRNPGLQISFCDPSTVTSLFTYRFSTTVKNKLHRHQ